MPKTLLAVDVTKKPWEQDPPLHNRWHPDIPAVATVKPGEVFKVETIACPRVQNVQSTKDCFFFTKTVTGSVLGVGVPGGENILLIIYKLFDLIK